MTLFLEISGPFQAKPDLYTHETMVRFVWLWFAVGWLRVPFKTFATTAYDWDDGGVHTHERYTSANPQHNFITEVEQQYLYGSIIHSGDWPTHDDQMDAYHAEQDARRRRYG